jgi:hypothetical protein
MENVHSFEIDDPVIDAHEHGCPGPAGRGITIDRLGSGVNTSNGIIRHPSINSALQGDSHDANFVGIWVSPTSFSNVEDIRIFDPTVGCNTRMGVGENTTGIIFGPSSFNAKAEEIVHPYGISNCTVAVHTGVGGVFVNGGDGGSSGIDFPWGGNADPTEIKNYTSENSGQFFSGVGGGGGSFPVLFENNHSAGGPYAAPNKCDVDLNSGGTVAMTATLINNGWDAAVVPNHPAVCGNQQSHNVFINNVYQAWPTAGPMGFPYVPGKNYGADYPVINGGRLRVGTANTWSVWDAGYGFIGVHGTEIPGTRLLE